MISRENLMRSKLNFKKKIITVLILFSFSAIITTTFNFSQVETDKSSDFYEDTNLINLNLKISKISEKIHIYDNWSAAKFDGICTGNGTYSNPYIIEDLVIDGSGSGSCIWVENSEVYFIIENCTLYNSGGYWDDSGIRLSYVKNSQIINNTCLNNFYGIFLSGCANNTITENTANSNRDGIYLNGGAFNNVSGNIANRNDHFGITSYSNQYNTISENKVINNYYGIELFESYNNTISNNLLESWLMQIWHCYRILRVKR